MILKNIKTGEIYENANKTQIAQIVGVDRVTVYRWSVKHEFDNKPEKYRDWEIYFNTIVLRRGM